jgi:hypothetical protein
MAAHVMIDTQAGEDPELHHPRGRHPAYRAGTTAASLAITYGLSLRSVKRLLSSAGIRRNQVLA